MTRVLDSLMHGTLAVGTIVILALVTCVEPLLGIAGAMLFMVGVGSLKWLPQIGLLVLVGFVPIDGLDQIPGAPASMSITKLMFPVAFGLLALQMVTRKQPIVLGGQGRMMLCFAAAVLVSAVINGHTYPTVDSVRRYASVFMLAFFVANATDSEDLLKILFAVMVLTCFVSALMGLFEHFLGTPSALTVPEDAAAAADIVAGLHEGRTSGLSEFSPNEFGAQVIFVLLPLLYFAFTIRRLLYRAALLGLCMVMGLAIVFSESRGTILVVIMCVPYLLYKLRKRVSVWKLVAVLLLVGVCMLPFVPTDLYERFTELTSPHQAFDPSILRRIGYNLVGLDLLRRSPIWGVGPGMFGTYYQSQDYRYLVPGRTARPLHNLYLSIACHMGLVGFTFFALMIACVFRSLVRIRATYDDDDQDAFLNVWSHAFELGLIGYLLAAALLPNQYSKYLWMSVGLTAAAEMIRRKQVKAAANEGSREVLPVA